MSSLLYLLLVPVGAAVLFRWFRARRLVAQSRAWPAATATIIAADLHERTTRDAAGDLETTYDFVVRYDYVVDGVSYSGSEVRHGENVTTSRREGQRWATHYVVGASVPAYYDPSSPACAVLEQSAAEARLGGLAVGAGLMVLGVLLAAGALKDESPAGQHAAGAAVLGGTSFVSSIEQAPAGGRLHVTFSLELPRGWALDDAAGAAGYYIRAADRAGAGATRAVHVLPVALPAGAGGDALADLAAAAASGAADSIVTGPAGWAADGRTYEVAWRGASGAGAVVGRVVLVPAGDTPADSAGLAVVLAAYPGSGITSAEALGRDSLLALPLETLRLRAR